MAGILISIARDLVLNHALPDRANLIFHGSFLVLAICGIVSARLWLHGALALVSGGAVLLYVGLLFARLH